MGKPASLHFHARPPFSEAAGDVAINLQVWRDPACQTRLSVRIDWYTSLGKLVLRYRAIAAAWPIILAFLCIRRQLLETGAAPPSSFNEALVSVIRLDLPRLSSLSVAIAVTQSLASAISQTHWRGLQNALLGTDRAFFWALPPLLLYITAGAVVTLHWATFGVLLVNAKVWEVAIAKLAFSGMPRCVQVNIGRKMARLMKLSASRTNAAIASIFASQRLERLSASSSFSRPSNSLSSYYGSFKARPL